MKFRGDFGTRIAVLGGGGGCGAGTGGIRTIDLLVRKVHCSIPCAICPRRSEHDAIHAPHENRVSLMRNHGNAKPLLWRPNNNCTRAYPTIHLV